MNWTRNTPRNASQRIALALPQPRNPHALAARQRHAGQHGRGAGGQRQQAQRALARELDTLARRGP